MLERIAVFFLVLGCCAQDILGALVCFALAGLLWVLSQRREVAPSDPVR